MIGPRCIPLSGNLIGARHIPKYGDLIGTSNIPLYMLTKTYFLYKKTELKKIAK